MPIITVADAWAERPKGILKTNEQGSRVKRIARGEGGRFTLYTESAPKGVRVAGSFPLWCEGKIEPTRERPAEGQIKAAPQRPAPSRQGYAKSGTRSRDLTLTDKALDGIALAQRNMIRRAFKMSEVKSLEE